MGSLYLAGLLTLAAATAIELGIRKFRRSGRFYHEDGLKVLRTIAYPLFLISIGLVGVHQRQRVVAENECRNQCGSILEDGILECGRKHPGSGNHDWVECVYDNRVLGHECSLACEEKQ